ncbi:MAG TPA: DUF3574 domain-containing protein [Planctomycetota bacterium]|nr:DUF3574 domain-containing protein [Planctomycetota bacterium]
MTRKQASVFVAALAALLFSASGCEKSCRCASLPALTQKVPSEATWIKTELYFGTSKPDGSVVTAEEWQEFLDKEITPVFKEGLTVIDGYGQYLNEKGVIAREKCKMLVVLYEPSAEKEAGLSKVIAAYKKRFQQESVLRVSQPASVKFE